MICIAELSKSYQEGTSSEQLVLDHCSFQAQPGDRIMIGGENGAGKTTFLKILGLLDKKYHGQYILDGTDVASMNPKQLAQLRNSLFGFVFQDYQLLEGETVYENIRVPLLYSEKWKRHERKARIQNICEDLELQDLMKKRVGSLSGGEKQRVAVARAIVNDPGIIILDEPTNALSSRLKSKVMAYLEEMADHNKILIIVTHDPSAVDKQRYLRYEIQNGTIRPE